MHCIEFLFKKVPSYNIKEFKRLEEANFLLAEIKTLFEEVLMMSIKVPESQVRTTFQFSYIDKLSLARMNVGKAVRRMSLNISSSPIRIKTFLAVSILTKTKNFFRLYV